MSRDGNDMMVCVCFWCMCVVMKFCLCGCWWARDVAYGVVNCEVNSVSVRW